MTRSPGILKVILETQRERRKAGDGIGRSRINSSGSGKGIALDARLPFCIEADAKQCRNEKRVVSAVSIAAIFGLNAALNLNAPATDDSVAVRYSGSVGVNQVVICWL